MKYIVYKVFLFFVKLFYPKTEFEGQDNLPDGPCIIAANHAQMDGPIAGILYYPREKRIWCIGEMMHFKEVPAYAFQDFWSKKPKSVRWFFRILSYIIAPFAVCIFTEADTIGVYRDKRLADTLKDSVEALKRREDVIIFPESPTEHNNIIYKFQTGFVDVARMYHRETGENVYFVPMYNAPALKKVVIGKPTVYNSENKPHDERERICDYLMNEITEMARSLPRHTVKPYPNIPREEYPENI